MSETQVVNYSKAIVGTEVPDSDRLVRLHVNQCSKIIARRLVDMNVQITSENVVSVLRCVIRKN
jgi:hypothetical protein